MGLVRPSVRPSVCRVRVPNSKNKRETYKEKKTTTFDRATL